MAKIRVMSFTTINGNRTEHPYKRDRLFETREELEEYRKRKLETNHCDLIAVNYSEELEEEKRKLWLAMSEEDRNKNIMLFAP